MPNDHPARLIIDVAAGGTVVATLAGWFPPIAAFLSIVWLSIQIFTWVRKKGWRA